MDYLSLAQILAMQEVLLQRYGGSSGIRDKNLLESAISQPAQTAFGEDIFKTLPEKAAAYAFYLCKNHPFVDGNKRIAAAAALTFIRLNGWDLNASQEEFYQIMMSVAASELSREKLTGWFTRRCSRKKSGRRV